MKRLILLSLLITTPVFAQTPSVENLQTALGAARLQREQALDNSIGQSVQIDTLTKQIADLNKQIKDLKDAADKDKK